MEPGHLVDHSHARLCTPLWVPGPADWTGVQWLPKSKLKGRDVHGVLSHRCPECGLLQSYAVKSATSRKR
jgi:hypothetical protein